MIKPKPTNRYNYDTKLFKDFMKNILNVSNAKIDVMLILMIKVILKKILRRNDGIYSA